MNDKLWAKLDPSGCGHTDSACIKACLLMPEFFDRITARFGAGADCITLEQWNQASLEGAMMHPNDDNLIKMMEQVWDIVEDEENSVHKKQAM